MKTSENEYLEYLGEVVDLINHSLKNPSEALDLIKPLLKNPNVMYSRELFLEIKEEALQTQIELRINIILRKHC